MELNVPEYFKQGYRGIVLVHRKKDGESNEPRKSIKRITLNADQWNKTVEELYLLREKMYPQHRIYASVNARNMLKAIHEFELRQLNHKFASWEEHYTFYGDITNRFFSCFMKPTSRLERNFLFDCDTVDEYDRVMKLIPDDKLIWKYPTKNGHHIITYPFDPSCVKDNLHKDGLLYIG